MVKKPTLDIQDEIVRQHVENINAEFSENILELSAAPAAADPLLEDNQRGIYGTDYYVRLGSTIYVFAATSTITIT